MLFLIDINQVMLISDADADFDWSLDALRLVQNQLILIDHGTDAAPKVRKSYQRNIDSDGFWEGLKKVLIKYETHPPPTPQYPKSQFTFIGLFFFKC